MAKKRKTLPKNFSELLKKGDPVALKTVFDACELEAYDDTYSKRTALAQYGVSAEFAQWLLQRGADVNSRDYYGRTPVFYMSDAEVLSLLLRYGADVSARDRYANTPLHFAAKYFKAQNVRMLLAAGADAAAKNDMGETPLEGMLRVCRNINIAACAQTAQIF